MERIQPVCDDCRAIYVSTGNIPTEHEDCMAIISAADLTPDPVIPEEKEIH